MVQVHIWLNFHSFAFIFSPPPFITWPPAAPGSASQAGGGQDSVEISHLHGRDTDSLGKALPEILLLSFYWLSLSPPFLKKLTHTTYM